MKLPKRENLIMTNSEDPLNFYYYPVIGWVYRKRLINTLSLIKNRRFERILEIGFGSGILFSELNDRGNELHGIEIHERIPDVIEKMRDEGLNPILKQASIYNISYEDNFFDCIVSVSTFEHLTDLDKAVLEIKRVAKPGAYIVLSFPVRNLVTDMFYSAFGFKPRDLHPNSHNDILNAAAKHLKLLKLKKFPSFLPHDASLYMSALFSKGVDESISRVQEHFDSIAQDYDTKWKKRNSYYYQNLKGLYQEFIQPGKRLLDYGCGTGEIIAALAPSRGVGFDISQEMLKRAKDKFGSKPNLYFTNSATDPALAAEFDYIILADVVEHLEDVYATFNHIRSLCRPQTRVIISIANPAWEPLLMILEKLKLKMPEGPHKWVKFRKLREILGKTGFSVELEGARLLVPTRSVPFADFMNRNFHKIFPLKKLGLIGYFVAKPK